MAGAATADGLVVAILVGHKYSQVLNLKVSERNPLGAKLREIKLALNIKEMWELGL